MAAPSHKPFGIRPSLSCFLSLEVPALSLCLSYGSFLWPSQENQTSQHNEAVSVGARAQSSRWPTSGSCSAQGLCVGKSVGRGSLRILSRKLRVRMPTLQGCFQDEIKQCLGRRTGAGRHSPKTLVPTFPQFISANTRAKRPGRRRGKALPLWELIVLGLLPASIPGSWFLVPGDVACGPVTYPLEATVSSSVKQRYPEGCAWHEVRQRMRSVAPGGWHHHHGDHGRAKAAEIVPLGGIRQNLRKMVKQVERDESSLELLTRSLSPSLIKVSAGRKRVWNRTPEPQDD